MMATCERAVEVPLRRSPARRRVERIVARPTPIESPRPGRSRLVVVGAVSVVAHVAVLAALGTVKLVSANIAPPPAPVMLAGTVRILTEGEAPGAGVGDGEVAVTEPVVIPAGPKLVAMNQELPAMPAVRSPFAESGPVIAVDSALAPAGVGGYVGRGSETERAPAAVAAGGGGAGEARGSGGGGGPGIAVLYSPRPVYPAAARSAGIEGVTVVRMEVQPTGAVGAVVVVASSGHEALDAAAVAAVRKWKFAPLRAAGGAVSAWVEQAIKFRMQRG